LAFCRADFRDGILLQNPCCATLGRIEESSKAVQKSSAIIAGRVAGGNLTQRHFGICDFSISGDDITGLPVTFL
jgi:hypothetical protein